MLRPVRLGDEARDNGYTIHPRRGAPKDVSFEERRVDEVRTERPDEADRPKEASQPAIWSRKRVNLGSGSEEVRGDALVLREVGNVHLHAPRDEVRRRHCERLLRTAHGEAVDDRQDTHWQLASSEVGPAESAMRCI